jgi:hypothetical protein
VVNGTLVTVLTLAPVSMVWFAVDVVDVTLPNVCVLAADQMTAFPVTPVGACATV